MLIFGLNFVLVSRGPCIWGDYIRDFTVLISEVPKQIHKYELGSCKLDTIEKECFRARAHLGYSIFRVG